MPRADMAGNDDPRSGGKAGDKADHKVGIGTCGGYGGKGVRVQVVAHNQGVHRAVKLLEEIACEDWQSEAEHFPAYASFRHQGGMLRHRIFSAAFHYTGSASPEGIRQSESVVIISVSGDNVHHERRTETQRTPAGRGGKPGARMNGGAGGGKKYGAAI